MFAFLQFLVVTALSYAAFGLGVWALVDAARRAPGVFENAGKQTKTLWVVILSVATAILFISLPFPYGSASMSILYNFVGLAAAVAVIVYHVGVKPALGQHRKGPRGGGRSTKGGW